MSDVNTKRELAFSDHFIDAYVVENAHNLRVEDGVALNLSSHPMQVGGDVPSMVPAWKSTNLINGVIASAKRVAVISVRQKIDLGGIIFGKWDWFGNRFAKFPRTTPLYISQYDSGGRVSLDPFHFAHQRADAVDIHDYDIRLNLWWSPANTDCYLHNEHPFLEIHTQIHGFGRIQKFLGRDDQAQCEEICMSPGRTHDPFCNVGNDRNPTYPWHRYLSDSDAVWLAIEFHPVAEPASDAIAV